MATLTVTPINIDGAVITQVASTPGGDQFQISNGKEYLLVTNNDGSTVTITVVTEYERGGLALADKELTIGAGEQKLFGPFPTDIYADSSGFLQMSHDGTSVDVAPVRLP